jgi:Domain of unknown function (DUF4397)
MRKSKSQGIRFWAGFLALAVGWTGCTKMASTASSSTGNGVTYIVLMNMAPYSPPAEIYLNDIKATSTVAAGTYSTSYAHITPAVYDVKFKVSGGDSLLSEIPASLYDSLSFYTLILYNDAINGPAKSIKIADNYNGVTVNSAYYRFIDMCPETPSLDLYLNNNLVQQARKTADIVSYTNLTQFQAVVPTMYSVQLKKAGTDSVVYSVANAEFIGGNAYTIFLSGSANAPADPISLNILKAAY